MQSDSPDPAPAVANARRNARLRVLVVDDEPTVRTALRIMLEGLAFKFVFEASDGKSALASMLRSTPDLILCDIRMQPMDGPGFVAALHSRGFVGEDRIPMIFLTSHAERELVLAARESGIDDFVVKPVDRDELAVRIEAVFRRHGIS